jgi:hypothetical protein
LPQLIEWIIIPDDTHQLHIRQVAGRCGKKNSGTAKDFVSFAKRSLDGIESD